MINPEFALEPQPQIFWKEAWESLVGRIMHLAKKQKKKPRKNPNPDMGHGKSERRKQRPGRRPVRR